jgi:transcription regulator MmyB-like protein
MARRGAGPRSIGELGTVAEPEQPDSDATRSRQPGWHMPGHRRRQSTRPRPVLTAFHYPGAPRERRPVHLPRPPCERHLSRLGRGGGQHRGPAPHRGRTHPYDKGLTNLIGELCTRILDFRTRWAAHEVYLHRPGTKRFYTDHFRELSAWPVPTCRGRALLTVRMTAEAGA